MEAGYKKAGVLERCRALSYSQQREYMLWIGDTKNAETRARRVAKSIDMIKARKT